jgi:predicted transcriptional regulator
MGYRVTYSKGRGIAHAPGELIQKVFGLFLNEKSPMVYLESIYFCRNEIAMKVLSLKLDDEVFDETERIISKLDLARNRYINEALALYNKYNRRKMLKSQLAREAALANATSMDVLREFEALADDQAI